MPDVLEQNPSLPTNRADIFYPSSTDEKEIIYPEQREDDSGETSENSFRLFDPQKNEFLRTQDEAEGELERLRLEINRLKADK